MRQLIAIVLCILLPSAVFTQTQTSAVNNSFQEVTSHLDPGGFITARRYCITTAAIILVMSGRSLAGSPTRWTDSICCPPTPPSLGSLIWISLYSGPSSTGKSNNREFQMHIGDCRHSAISSQQSRAGVSKQHCPRLGANVDSCSRWMKTEQATRLFPERRCRYRKPLSCWHAR